MILRALVAAVLALMLLAVCLGVAPSPARADTQRELFERANAAYARGDYPTAIHTYEQLAESGATQADFTTSNEGTSLGQMFPEEGPGEFMTNWTFVYKNYQDTIGAVGGPADEQAFEDLAWARYPQTVEGEESRPPIGGIDIGVGAYSENLDYAQEAAVCVTSPEAQAALAVNDGLMPSRNSVYDSPKLQDAYPADLLDLYRDSIDTGAPRPKSAFYAQISSAVQSVWHSPASVSPDSTPEESAEFLRAVLSGEALL